jgi:hypothetical protein
MIRIHTFDLLSFLHLLHLLPLPHSLHSCLATIYIYPYPLRFEPLLARARFATRIASRYRHISVGDSLPPYIRWGLAAAIYPLQHISVGDSTGLGEAVE